MHDATLTSKSQLTLPKSVRDALGVGPGDRVRFVPSLKGFRILALKGDVTQLRGMFAGRRSEPLSVSDIDAAIVEAVTRRSEGSKDPKSTPG